MGVVFAAIAYALINAKSSRKKVKENKTRLDNPLPRSESEIEP